MLLTLNMSSYIFIKVLSIFEVQQNSTKAFRIMCTSTTIFKFNLQRNILKSYGPYTKEKRVDCKLQHHLPPSPSRAVVLLGHVPFRHSQYISISHFGPPLAHNIFHLIAKFKASFLALYKLQRQTKKYVIDPSYSTIEILTWDLSTGENCFVLFSFY